MAKMKTILVSGCTRSGTTLIMQILNGGGYPCAGEPPSFEKYNIGEIPWVELKGKAIKLIDPFSQYPPIGDYHVIKLERNLTEQAKSINKFSEYILGLSPISLKLLEYSLMEENKSINNWAKKQSGFCDIKFEDIINNPKDIIKKISSFIGFDLNKNCEDIIFKRTTNCYDGLLELKMVKYQD